MRGEYIVYLGLDEQLSLFKEQLIDIEPTGELSSCQELMKFSYEFNKFNRAISFVIDSYRYFIITLQNKYRLDNHHYLVNAFSKKGRDRDLSPLFRLFCDIELPITYLDHFFVSSDSQIRELIYSKNELESQIKNNDGRIKDILYVFLTKCNFLLIKLLRGKEADNPEYLLDFEYHLLDKDTGSKVFNTYLRLYDFYYKESYGENEPEIVEIRPRILEKSLSFKDIVLLAKYYKDTDSATIIQYDNLVKEFDSKYAQALSLFGERNYDKYAIRTLKNYIVNCRLSFVLKRIRPDFDQAVNEIEKIRAIQNETGIYNFYPYKKIVEYYIHCLKDYLHSDTFEERTFDARFIETRKELRSLISAVKWCKECSFFPILNLFKDCTEVDDVLNFKVFTPSSYSRYVDYDELSNCIEDLKHELRQLEAEKAIIIETENVKELKREVSDARRTVIEVFGIFTGVVALVFGGMDLFTDKEIPQSVINTISSSGENAVSYWNSIISSKLSSYLAFGSSLVVFVSLIYFIALPRENSFKDYFRHPKTVIFLLLLLISIILILIIVFR